MAKDDDKTAAEGAANLRYPYHVGFVLVHEFCERFAYNGVTALLTLYVFRVIELDAKYSTIVFHAFISLNTALAIIGSLVSDIKFGRYYLILYGTLVYVTGIVIITIGSIKTLHLPEAVFCIMGLVLIAMAMGGVKPCTNVFGADQYKVPEQQTQLDGYFPMYAYAATCGALSALYITPNLRAHVRCFGEVTCYPLGFGIPAIILFIGFSSIFIGTKWFTKRPPKNDLVILFVKAVFYAAVKSWKSNEKRDHWMDHADDKYEKGLIFDIKAILRFVIVYIPVIIYWTLEGQYGSRWTLQAARLNGEIGSWRLLPEMMQMLIPLLDLVLIPLSSYVIYPLLKPIGIKRPLQKMVLGGILTAVSYIASAILEFKMEAGYPILPKEGNAQLRIFNSEACNYDITTNIAGQEKFILKAFDVYTYKDIGVPNEKFEFTYKVTSTDAACPAFTTEPILIAEKTACTIFLNSRNKTQPIFQFEDDVDKPHSGYPLGRVIVNIKDEHRIIWKDETDEIIDFQKETKTTFPYGLQRIFIDDKEVMEIKLHMGGSYTIIIYENTDGSYLTRVHLMVPENLYHILWLLPQYLIFNLGGVIFQITNIQFLYQEAPGTMKGVIQAIGYESGSLGNVLVIVITMVEIGRQTYEFLFYSFLMFVDIAIFALLGYRYKSYDPTQRPE